MARRRRKKRPKLWIRRAIRRPGAFTRKARRAKKGVQAYARQVIAKDSKRYGLRTLRQAVLARTLAKLPKRGRRRRKRRR